MDSGGFSWTLLTIVGPVVLLLALAYALIRNRRSRIPKEVSEAGTRRVYAEEEEKRRTGQDDSE